MRDNRWASGAQRRHARLDLLVALFAPTFFAVLQRFEESRKGQKHLVASEPVATPSAVMKDA